MNFSPGEERRRDAAAAADQREPIPVPAIVRAHLAEGVPFVLLLLVGLSGWMWWAGHTRADEAWGIWAIVAGVAGYAVPLLTMRDLGDRLGDAPLSRAGIFVSWLLIGLGTALVCAVPAWTFGRGITGPAPLEEPWQIYLACLTPFVVSVTLIGLLLRLWTLSLWLSVPLGCALVLAAVAFALPLPVLAYREPAVWVEPVAVFGGLALLPLCLLTLALMPLHRVAAVAEYADRLP